MARKKTSRNKRCTKKTKTKPKPTSSEKQTASKNSKQQKYRYNSKNSSKKQTTPTNSKPPKKQIVPKDSKPKKCTYDPKNPSKKPTTLTDSSSQKFTYDPKNVTKLRCPIKCYEICHDKFLTYDEIQTYLKNMEQRYPEKLQLEVIGTSLENRPIFLAIISNNLYGPEKMVTLVEAGSNGSDWLAIATALYLIDFLTKNLNLAKIMDYYILPCANPDAYDKSIKKSTLNKQTPLNLTNNFPIILGTTDMRDITTEEFLIAMKNWKQNLRFASPVTRSVYRSIASSQSELKLFISLQENGQTIVYPFGCAKKQLLDEKDLVKVATAAQTSMKRINVNIGSLYTFSGLTFGSAIDFIRFHCSQTKFAYILNIKDRQKEPKAEEILVYGDDVVNCVKCMARNIYMYYNKVKKINKKKCG